MGLYLDATDEQLQFVLAVAKTTTALEFNSSAIDWLAGTPSTTPVQNAGTSNDITDVDLVAAPGGSTQRIVKEFSIYNKDSVQATVTVKWDKVAGSLERIYCKVTLDPDDTLHYEDVKGFYTTDRWGNTKLPPVLPGSLLNSVVKTSGTTFTTGPRTTRLWLRMRGGGGAGGGVTSSASTGAGGGGGSEGGWLDAFVYVTPSTAYTYQVGAAGTGSSGADGGNGTASTFIIGSTTYSASLGNGGKVGTAAATGVALGGAAPAVATGDANNVTEINGSGSPGSPGLWISASVVASGKGGGEGGGNSLKTSATGNAAIANTGSGGGGACQVSAGGAAAGGAGAAGFVEIDEYTG